MFSKETELLLKKYVLSSLGYKERHPVIQSNNGEEVTILTDTINGHVILHDENDSRVRLVTTVVDHLKRACIYFSPESEDYFNKLQLYIVDDPDTVNAFSAMGGVMIVYTGIINLYMEAYEKGLIKDVETVRIRLVIHH